MREWIGVRADVPTVADTKSAFIKAYRKPIPSIYSNVIQEILVQQHLMRYNTTYTYDPIFALGFVTVFDQLMDGYPSETDRDARQQQVQELTALLKTSETDRDAIFKAYITALNEDPELYRSHIHIFPFHLFLLLSVCNGEEGMWTMF